MPNYKMGFWNYMSIGTYDMKESIKDWKELGMNLPISFRYISGKSNKTEMLEFLDECSKNNIQVLLDDSRVDFRTFLKISEEEYRKGVREAIEDFGTHPAVYGFHIGDEPYGLNTPWGNAWETAKKAVMICYEYAPNLNHFINLLPYWKNEDDKDNDNFFYATGVRTSEEYYQLVRRFIVETGIKCIGYDCYADCCYFNKEHYKDVYFLNLKLFTKAVEGLNVELFSSLLSVGHNSLRVPNEDDIRFQISTSIASGVKGLLWFYLYERYSNSYNFRGSPYDNFHNKTETYNNLARQSRIFMEFIAPSLADYRIEWVKHFNKTYGGYDEIVFNDEIKNIRSIENETPLIITKFSNNENKVLYGVTNNHMSEPTFIGISFAKNGKDETKNFWLAPGQFIVL